MAPKRARGRPAATPRAPAPEAATPRVPAAERPRRAAVLRPRVAATRGRVGRVEEPAESPPRAQPAPRAARGRPRARAARGRPRTRQAIPPASEQDEHSVDDVIGQRVADFLGPGADRDFPAFRAHRTPTLMSCIRDLKDLQTREFSGDRDPVAADSWLTEVAADLVRAAIPERFKVDAVASRFRGDAAEWWRVRSTSVEDTAGYLQWTWFERVFREEYVPASAIRRFEAQFRNLEQGGRSVNDFISVFNRLARYAPAFVTTEAKRVDEFVRMLRPEIRDRVDVYLNNYTFATVCDAARYYEAALQERRAESSTQSRPPATQDRNPNRTQTQRHWQSNNRRNQRPRQDNRRNNRDQTRPQQPAQQQPCRFCGGNHPGVCFRQQGTCFRCGKAGHFVKDCPMDAPPRVAGRPEGRVYVVQGAQPRAAIGGPERAPVRAPAAGSGEPVAGIFLISGIPALSL
jgi:hypothetical protein